MEIKYNDRFHLIFTLSGIGLYLWKLYGRQKQVRDPLSTQKYQAIDQKIHNLNYI